LVVFVAYQYVATIRNKARISVWKERRIPESLKN